MDIQYVGAMTSSVKIGVVRQREAVPAMDEFRLAGLLWRLAFCVLALLGVTLGLGMSWAHIRRRASGQASVDRVDN